MVSYTEAKLEIIAFEAEDVITTSCPTDNNGCVGDDD